MSETFDEVTYELFEVDMWPPFRLKLTVSGNTCTQQVAYVEAIDWEAVQDPIRILKQFVTVDVEKVKKCSTN